MEERMDKNKTLLVVLLVLSVVANIVMVKMYTREKEINDFVVSQGVDGRRNFTIAYEYLLTNFATETSAIHQNYNNKDLNKAKEIMGDFDHTILCVNVAQGTAPSVADNSPIIENIFNEYLETKAYNAYLNAVESIVKTEGKIEIVYDKIANNKTLDENDIKLLNYLDSISNDVIKTIYGENYYPNYSNSRTQDFILKRDAEGIEKQVSALNEIAKELDVLSNY
jgi:hypothetical protein